MTTTKPVKLFLIAAFTLACFQWTTANADQFRVRLHDLFGQKTLAEDVIAEIRFGRHIAARILGQEKTYDDPKLTRYIRLVGNSLAMHSSRTDINFHFGILDKEIPNAYSAPGGYVFITLGAIKLAQDEAELAAIIAHEIAHISERHIVKELKIKGQEDSGLTGLTRLLGATGDTARIALSKATDKALEILFNEGYKVTEEAEADRTAILLLAETGYDPTALQRYLQRIEENKADNDARSKTHPTSEDRYRKLSELIKAEGLEDPEFKKLRERFMSHKPG